MNQLFYFGLQTRTNCSTLVYRHEPTVLPWSTYMNQLFYLGLQTCTNHSTLVYRHVPTVLPWSTDEANVIIPTYTTGLCCDTLNRQQGDLDKTQTDPPGWRNKICQSDQGAVVCEWTANLWRGFVLWAAYTMHSSALTTHSIHSPV